MFAVNRQNRHTMLHRLGSNDASGGYEGLLVGEGDWLAVTDGVYCWQQSCISNECRYNDVDAVKFHYLLQSVLARKHLYRMILQCVLHQLVFGVVGDDHGVWLKFNCLFYKQFPIAARCQHLRLKTVGIAPDDIQCLRSNAPCGA